MLITNCKYLHAPAVKKRVLHKCMLSFIAHFLGSHSKNINMEFY